MIGSFRRRGCTCKKKRCTCGSKWTYRYHVIDPATGKRKQKETRGFDTKDQAEAEAKRIQYELQQGTYIEEKDITFEQFATEWFKMYKNSGKVKQSTLDIRKAKLKYWMDHFGQIKIKDITKFMYEQFLNGLINKYAPKTIASIHEVGRMIYKRAIELEIVSKDITDGVEMPKKIETVEDLEEQTELPRYLEKDELDQFLQTCRFSMGIYDYVVFLTLAYTGLRVGELCALKWRDIDDINQTISITKTVYRKTQKSSEYALHTPKTKSSRRVIDVDEHVLETLSQHKKLQKVVSLDDRENDFVFATQQGYPLTTYYVYRRMIILLKRSGYKHHLPPHSLRHTHTSLLAEAGVSLEVIQARLGHQNDRITKKIYLHVTKPKRKEASQKFAQLMAGVRGQNVGNL